MGRKNLLIAWSLIGVIVVLVIGVFIIITDIVYDTVSFDNSTPKATAISIAKLNEGIFGFESLTVDSVYLTSDGKYWIVNMAQVGDHGGIVVVDAKTLASKYNGEWRSLDELKASYIAEIQSTSEEVGEPSKITMDGKEIWRIPLYKYPYDDLNRQFMNPQLSGYIYVDLATGTSKMGVFNKTVGTDGWLTLKQVDDIVNKRGYPGLMPFKDALRDLYSE